MEYLRTKALKGCTYFAVVDVSGQTRVCNTLAGQAVEEAVMDHKYPGSQWTMAQWLNHSNMNYCQLAKNSLVSKRFRDLIQTHRHSLALLYVNEISMDTVPFIPAVINIFDKELSSEAYNEWVIRHNYSKQVPRVCLIARAQGTQHIPSSYRFRAYAIYTDASHRGWNDRTLHSTDPFIHIGCVALTHRNDALTTLSGAVNPDRGHVRCKELVFHLRGNTWKSVIWIKKHVRCNQVSVYGDTDSKHDETVLDFLLTGAHFPWGFPYITSVRVTKRSWAMPVQHSWGWTCPTVLSVRVSESGVLGLLSYTRVG
ncbi:hypothetical protein DdX_21029 [Ditylenchus destructor]|uniref:Uncharacterized protein n=1 Tax=Ditylenchus destructor TaxID=166010 RepID=A0AAD4MGB3_9BILA|nr:hypothetical protein DdX_21029 [Ditylenchus destructor]